MKFLKTIRAKLFLLFVFVGFFPIVLHLLINYYFYNENPEGWTLFKFIANHALILHHTLFYEITATLICSFFIAVYITQPLRILDKITKQIKNKKFTKKINFKSEDEVGKLSKVLNKMLEQCRTNKKMLDTRSKNIVESEKKHRELLNLFADVLYEIDANERIIKAKHTELLFGYTEKELIGRKSFELVHPDDHAKLAIELEKMTIKVNKPIRDLKIRILTKTRKVRYCLLSGRTIFKKGKFVRREGVLRDITPRELLAQKVVKEKEKLEKMYENLHDSYLALGKINAQVAALAEINTTFSSNLDWKDKLHYIIESVRTFMQVDETLLFVQSNDGKKFKLKHASVDFDFWEDLELTRRNTLVKELIKYRKSLKYFKASDLLDKTKASAKNYKAMLTIPVIINNEVIGIFIVFSSNAEKLKDFPTRLTLAYTSQMSIALMMSGELDYSLKKIF